MNDFQAQAIRHMYRTDPSSFFDLAFRILHPGVDYEPHWSTKVLSDALARCCRGEIKRLIVNMPPRTLKSICASVALPAWLLAVRPQTKILCVAGHRGLADDHHALTLNLMSDPKYRALFPHVRFSTTASKISLPHGGYRLASTPTGALTGRGADLIIIDDPQRPDETDDPQKSSAIRRWYDRNIYQRLDEKASGVVILVMQRLAHDDFTAHVLSRGDWELIKLPAVAEEDERFPNVFGDRLIRKKREALNPTREGIPQLREAARQMGALAFRAQYQQRPYPPGQGGDRGGTFYYVHHPDATPEECKYNKWFVSLIPEELFLFEDVFGDFCGIRPGTPPDMTVEEWVEWCRRSQEERDAAR